MRTTIALLIGFLIGLMVSGGAIAVAQSTGLLYGTNAGLPIAVQTDASGNLSVILH